MTHPHIGNYGVEKIVERSGEPQLAGFVVSDVIEEPSSAHAQTSLSDYLSRNRVSAIAGVDTHALTRKIRTKGDARHDQRGLGARSAPAATPSVSSATTCAR